MILCTQFCQTAQPGSDKKIHIPYKYCGVLTHRCIIKSSGEERFRWAHFLFSKQIDSAPMFFAESPFRVVTYFVLNWYAMRASIFYFYFLHSDKTNSLTTTRLQRKYTCVFCQFWTTFKAISSLYENVLCYDIINQIINWALYHELSIGKLIPHSLVSSNHQKFWNYLTTWLTTHTIFHPPGW